MKRRMLLTLLGLVPSAAALPVVRNKKRHVMLQESPLAGFQYYEGESLWYLLKEGDELNLLAEPTNPYDKRAVAIFWGRYKLGYIPRRDNAAISQLLSRKESLTANITGLNDSTNPWNRLSVSVWLNS